MYEICNLVNLDVTSMSETASINLGNTRHLGDRALVTSLGGSEVIGNFSNNFSAEQNYYYPCRRTTQTQNKTTSTNTKQVKRKIANIVNRTKSKSYTATKKQDI